MLKVPSNAKKGIIRKRRNFLSFEQAVSLGHETMNQTIALVCSEPLKLHMAGIAIRNTEIARALALNGFNVSLYAPKIDREGYRVPEGVSIFELEPNSLYTQLAQAQAQFVLVQGHTAEAVINSGLNAKIIVDLYDPYLIENASYLEELGPSVFENDLRNWKALCAAGDFFLCACEAQKLFYCGFLVAQNRISAEHFNCDPTLKKLIGIVPFGVPSEIPTYKPYLPQAKPNSFRILFGGLYDWYDPLTLLEALNTSELDHCELIFVKNPNPESTPQKRLEEVLAWCQKNQWSDDRLNLIDWTPYERRYDLLRDVDLMVATHADTFETNLSMRTRFIDAIAAGCPVISSAGGDASKLLVTYEAGTVVPNKDVPELRKALLAALSEEATTRLGIGSHNQAAFRSAFAWNKVIEPLIEFCDSNALLSTPVETNLQSGVRKSFSILLPTYNRMDILPEVIAAIEQQKDTPSHDLIIVDDGSTDGTKEWLEKHTFSVPVTIIHQPNAGPASARNAAIAAAEGDYLALIGDDTVPDLHWLKSHSDAHKKQLFDPAMIVVGKTMWHDAMKQTPFLNYLDTTGWQFAFDQIEDSNNLPFNYFYGSNVSLARSVVRNERFNTSFPYPAWEDSELGYRLVSAGCRLIYAESALTAHLHITTLSRFAKRQRKAGYCAMVFNQLHPEVGALVWGNHIGDQARVGDLFSAGRLYSAVLLDWFGERSGWNFPKLWERALSDQYVRGIRDYLTAHNIDLQALSEQRDFPIVYLAISPVLHHHTGRAEQSLWQCKAQRDVAGHCVFGPNYRVTRNDNLCVSFFISLLSDEHDETAVTLDVYDSRNDRILCEEVITSHVLKANNKIDLSFVSTVDQQLEFRVYWHGQCDVAIEKIELAQQLVQEQTQQLAQTTNDSR